MFGNLLLGFTAGVIGWLYALCLTVIKKKSGENKNIGEMLAEEMVMAL